MRSRVSFSAVSLALAVSVSAVGGLLGCSSSRPPAAKEAPAPCPVSSPVLSIAASDRINSSAAGQPRPVQLRVYQLKSETRLVKAKFEEIWQNDAAVLEADLVKVEEHTVYPGESKQVKVTRNPDAHSLAAVALFREPQGKSWFLTYELETPKKAPPCGPAEPRISVWLDRMQIEDGQGRAPGSDSPASGTTPDRTAPEGAAGSKGH